MLIESKQVLEKLEVNYSFYLNQGRYAKAEAFSEAIEEVKSLERSANENEKGVHSEPSKGKSDSIPK